MELSIAEAVLRPPVYDHQFSGGIAHPDVYIWDAWSMRKDGGDIFLYTLASPRDAYKNGDIDIQTQRDHLPHHHRLFVSGDGGHSWKDRGPSFAPSAAQDRFDSRSIWTGSALPYQGKFLCAYTGIRRHDDAHPFIQGIGLAASDDGFAFTRVTEEALSCPMRDYDMIRAKGYYLGPRGDLGSGDGEEGGCILAWRDPGLQIDAKTGEVHAFWSAKSSLHSAQEPVLGHGIIHDPLGTPRLELLAPVRLPDSGEYTQAEVPQLVYNEKQPLYYMVVSTCNRSSKDQIDRDLELNARVYLSSDLNGGWERAGFIIRKKDLRYPAAITGFDAAPDGGTLHFMAPYSRASNEAVMHTMPAPCSALIRNGDVVSLSHGSEK